MYAPFRTNMNTGPPMKWREDDEKVWPRNHVSNYATSAKN